MIDYSAFSSRALIIEMEELGAQNTDRYQRAVAADREISEMLVMLNLSAWKD